MSEQNEDPEVRLGYSSPQNITFKGSWETGIPRSEWEKMSEERKLQVQEEAVWDLIEMWEMADDEEEPW